jgi:hypothetical protein
VLSVKWEVAEGSDGCLERDFMSYSMNFGCSMILEDMLSLGELTFPLEVTISRSPSLPLRRFVEQSWEM